MSTLFGRLFKKIFKDSDSDDWVKVGKNENVSLYYNSSSVIIDVQNHIIKVWGKRVFTKLGKSELFKNYEVIIKNQIYNGTHHLLSLHLLNYKEWKFSTNHNTFYSKSGKVLSDSECLTEWENIIPDSLSELFFNKIITDYSIQTDYNIQGADWVYGVGDELLTLYYNSSSIKIDKQKKLIKVWIKDVFTEKGKIEMLKDMNNIEQQINNDIEYMLFLSYLDYKQWKVSTTQLTIYSKSNNVLSNQEYPLEWNDIPPDSGVNQLSNKLLKDYNIQR